MDSFQITGGFGVQQVSHPLEPILNFHEDNEKIEANIREAMHQIGGGHHFELR